MDPPKIQLFSTDLDGTLLGNPVASWRFSDTWTAQESSQRPLLVYNTGGTVAATPAARRGCGERVSQEGDQEPARGCRHNDKRPLG